MVGICVGFFLVWGECEHDSVGIGEWSSRIEERNVGLEGEVSDDSFHSLEGYLVRGCVETGETGNSVHEVQSGVVTEVEKCANKGTVGAFISFLKVEKFWRSGRYGGCQEGFERRVGAERYG